MSYSKEVLDHYNNPRNVGSLDKNKDNVGTGLVGAPECFSGDTLIHTPIQQYISLKDAYELGRGINVWSYNIPEQRYQFKTAKVVYSGKKKLYTYEVEGRQLRVTNDHEFLTLEHGYRPINQIGINDFIRGVRAEIGTDYQDLFESAHKLIMLREDIDPVTEDCYTLQVEETNNYIVITHFDNEYYSGIVAKNCGDVMKLQIEVDENEKIVDAKFKTFGCFAGNVEINTVGKRKPIKDIKVGDQVWAWNGKSIVENSVKEVKTQFVDIEDLLCFEFQRSAHRKSHLTDDEQLPPGTFSIIVTREHVFWGADNKPVLAEDLKPGDELYEMTEFELRSKNNIFRSDQIKADASERMYELNERLEEERGYGWQAELPQNQKGRKMPEGYSERQKQNSLERWQDPVYRKNWTDGMASIDYNQITKLELTFKELFEKHDIAVRYAAGNVWIHTGQGAKSPDFVVPGKKKVIEVYTKAFPKFMQDRSDNSTYVEDRVAMFESAGFECLCVAIEDIDTAVEKVQNFIHNGMKIRSIEKITHRNMLREVERNDQGQAKVYDLVLEDGAHVYFSSRVASHNCGSALASSSLATEWIKNMTVDEALSIQNTDIVDELSLPPVKIHCSVLAEDAIKAAIADYRKKKQLKETENV